MRTINVELLNEVIQTFGGVKKLHEVTKVSESWLKKAKRGAYGSEPNPLTIRALCNISGFSEDRLFPLAPTRKKHKAS